MALTLAGTITADDHVLQVDGDLPDPLAAGYLFAIDSEVMVFNQLEVPTGTNGIADPTDLTQWSVTRGWGGTIPAGHDAEADIFGVVLAFIKGTDEVSPTSPYAAEPA